VREIKILPHLDMPENTANMLASGRKELYNRLQSIWKLIMSDNKQNQEAFGLWLASNLRQTTGSIKFAQK
jgi:hypothetical protein